MSEAAPPAEPQGTSGRVVVAGCAVLFIIVLCTTLAAAVLVPRRVQREQLATRSRCANGLRQIGLAAAQYADDKGAFPHLGPADGLDGDPSTPDTPRAFRLLVSGGYLDSPERLLCPAATARPRTTQAVRDAQRAWLVGDDPDAPSPALEACEEISYGWTRRALSRDAPADALLAADKAVLLRGGGEPRVRGNHTDGWNAVQVDASVRWLSVEDEPFPGVWLVADQDPQRDGYLGLAPQRDPSAFR